MPKILEEAKFYADHYVPDKVATHFLAPFRTIESEIKELSERIDKELRGQDSIIEGLKKDLVDAYEMLAQRTERIKALEEQYKEIYEMMASWETLKKIRRLKVEADLTKPVSTDKDRPFQVGDMIAHHDDMRIVADNVRIVLKVKSNNRMELLDKLTGDRWWSPSPQNYTLVSRPGSPKPEPTVKEEIATDRFGKPPGGLEPGDVIGAIDKEDRTHHIGLFHHIEKSVDGFTKIVFAYWKQIGEPGFQRELTWRPQGEVIFEFRPRFPDRKER